MSTDEGSLRKSPAHASDIRLVPCVGKQLFHRRGQLINADCGYRVVIKPGHQHSATLVSRIGLHGLSCFFSYDGREAQLYLIAPDRLHIGESRRVKRCSSQNGHTLCHSRSLLIEFVFAIIDRAKMGSLEVELARKHSSIFNYS